MGDLYFKATVLLDVCVLPVDEARQPDIELVAEEIQRILWNAACRTPWRAAIGSNNPLTVTKATYGKQNESGGLCFSINVLVGTSIATKQIYAFNEWIRLVVNEFAKLYYPCLGTQSTLLSQVCAAHEFKSDLNRYYKSPALRG